MRIHVALYYGGFALALTGLFMVLSAGIGLIYQDSSVVTLLISGAITMALGFLPIWLISKETDVSVKESIFMVVFGWIACCAAGAIPFYLYGTPFTLSNAFFESVSGFTATGASILQNVEDLPKGLLFWRALTHWIGGIGILAFAYFVMPRMGQITKSSLPQEYSGLGVRIKDIARGLSLVYIGLTAAQAILLMVVGQSWFDSITNSFSTVSAGGFSVRNLGIASYNSLSVEIITMLFMVLAGTNFILMLSFASRPKVTKAGREVFHFYLLMMTIFVLFTVFMVKGNVYAGWGEALRYGSFQVVAVATATGLGSADSSVWPAAAQVAIIIVTIIGGCAGSMAGAMKIDRIMLFFKLLKFRLINMIHPNIVASIRVDGKVIPLDNIERNVFYITVYLAVLCLATLALGSVGMTGVDSFSGSVACMANAGPGMGSLGTMENYSQVPVAGKWILTVVMLLGRLEVFALVLPFTPGFWRS